MDPTGAEADTESEDEMVDVEPLSSVCCIIKGQRSIDWLEVMNHVFKVFLIVFIIVLQTTGVTIVRDTTSAANGSATSAEGIEAAKREASEAYRLAKILHEYVHRMHLQCLLARSAALNRLILMLTLDDLHSYSLFLSFYLILFLPVAPHSLIQDVHLPDSPGRASLTAADQSPHQQRNDHHSAPEVRY
jgi:hypothetical protein